MAQSEAQRRVRDAGDLVANPLAFASRLARPAWLLQDAQQFNSGPVTRDEASGASVRKDVEVRLLSAAPTSFVPREFLLRRDGDKLALIIPR
jgi:hypothetical protein